MSPLVPCPACARHVRASETACPFCARALPDGVASLAVPPLAPTLRLDRLAMLTFATTLATGLTVAACGGGAADDDGAFVAIYGAPATDSGSMIAAYGLPPGQDGGDSRRDADAGDAGDGHDAQSTRDGSDEGG